MQIVTEQPASLYSGRRVRDVVLAILTCAALYFCWKLARPFLGALTWALALSIVAHPWHRRLERFLHPNVAAMTTVFLIMFVILAPGTLLIQRAIHEAADILAATDSGSARAVLDRVPLLGRGVDWLEQRFDLNQELSRSLGDAAKRASALVTGSIQAIVQFSIMLVILFFFLRDRKTLLGYLRELVPLSVSETEQLFTGVTKTVHATLYGNVVVKIVQGVLGGAMFWALGLPAPVVFGAAMALCATIPIFGTSLIWGPAAVYLLIQGSWIKAILLIAWGALVISLIDNVLYPIFVASELRIHTLGVLLAVLGGLISFGLAGVVLGPVILASTVALLRIWQARTSQERDRIAP